MANGSSNTHQPLTVAQVAEGDPHVEACLTHVLNRPAFSRLPQSSTIDLFLETAALEHPHIRGAELRQHLELTFPPPRPDCREICDVAECPASHICPKNIAVEMGQRALALSVAGITG